MNNDYLFEEIGQISDMADNLLAARLLPIPNHISEPALRSSLMSLRDRLRKTRRRGHRH